MCLGEDKGRDRGRERERVLILNSLQAIASTCFETTCKTKCKNKEREREKKSPPRHLAFPFSEGLHIMTRPCGRCLTESCTVVQGGRLVRSTWGQQEHRQQPPPTLGEPPRPTTCEPDGIRQGCELSSCCVKQHPAATAPWFDEEIKAYWLPRLRLMQIAPAINALFMGQGADVSTELGAKLTRD